ncbi:MAG: CPBP family intramembrane metalloprotease [Spirochaetaceae bacterium]|jgi:hypothetical protein|nr:CPBP family intramembrane metalloprotease [Spirochaetaceae bacterium]
MNIILAIKKYNQTVIIALSSLLITLFTYLTPPGILADLLPQLSLFADLEGDLPHYITRFFLSLLLFAVIPIVYTKSAGNKLSSLGLNKSINNPLKDKFYLFLILLCLAIGISSAYNQSLSLFYPYSKTLTHLVITKSWIYFPIHVVSYIVFYYLPWEIFFRGFLILPFLPSLKNGDKTITPQLIMIASFQVIPSSIIHFGHPLSETLGAIPFGIICGWLVLKYRSILPGLLLHLITGITMDLIITVKAAF